MTHHDTRYRDLFSHVEMVRALFGGILQACVGDTVSPPGVESFDWDRAQMLHSGFVSETLEQRHSDCIWRLLYRSTDMNLDPEPDSESGSDSDSDSDSDTDTDTDTDIGTGTGTGTVNTLVLALLSFIADLKPDTVIFAMEEPEIAVPPHTQRRIAQYLLTKTTQAFVTSHSPFVIEKFEPSKTLLLSRDGGMVSACKVSDATGLKDNDYKRFSRAGLSECMLGRAAIVVEGVTELHAMPIVARRMEENDPNLQPLDIAGVAFFDADGESNMPKFGKFFRTLGLRTFAFYDLDYKKKRKAEQAQALADNFEINVEHAYKGFEDLLVAEVPVDRLWSFLAGLKENNEHGNIAIPDERPSDDAVKAIAKESLGGNKGAGWSARLLEECEFDQLPATVTQFLASVFALFPPPPPIYEDGGDNSDLLA